MNMLITSAIVSGSAVRAPFNPASAYALLRFSPDQMFVPAHLDGEELAGVAFRNHVPVFGSRCQDAAPNPGILYDVQNGLEPIISFARAREERTGQVGLWSVDAAQVRYLRQVALSLQRPGAQTCEAGVEFVLASARQALQSGDLSGRLPFLGLIASGLVINQPLPDLVDGGQTEGELAFAGAMSGTITSMRRDGNLVTLQTEEGVVLLEDYRALQDSAPFVPAADWILDHCQSDTAILVHVDGFCELLDVAQAQRQAALV